MPTDNRVMQVLQEAKRLAKEYYKLTGKPLGITGEVAEYEAARILGITLTAARQDGHDAIERTNGSVKKLQIKGRCLQTNCKPGQRLGGIQLKKDWDSVLMVLLDENFDATAIYEAKRDAIRRVLTAPGSKARNERGALAVSKFKAIGKLRWPTSENKRVTLVQRLDRRRIAPPHHWTPCDDVVAVYLYKHGEAQIGLTYDQIALRLGMSTASLKMRIGNVRNIDRGTGLGHVAEQTRAMFAQYGALPEPELRAKAIECMQ